MIIVFATLCISFGILFGMMAYQDWLCEERS
jgi:hypothetical protein